MKSKATTTAQVVGAARWTLSLALALGCLAATGWFAHPGASGGQSAPIVRLGLVRVISEEAGASATGAEGGAVGGESSSVRRQTQPEASRSANSTVSTAEETAEPAIPAEPIPAMATVSTANPTVPTAEQAAEAEGGHSSANLPRPQAGKQSGSASPVTASSTPVSLTQDPAPAHPQGSINGQANGAAEKMVDIVAAAPALYLETAGRPDENSGEPGAELEAARLDAGFALRRPVRPGYPPLAKRLGKRGRVRLELGIDPEGRVYRVNVMHETGGWGFGSAAAAAYRHARFTRPTVQGRPVRVLWRKTIIFRP